VAVGTTAPFEIQSLDFEKKRMGVALVPDESRRADSEAEPSTAVESAPERLGSLADKLKGAWGKGE
jgi:hypothetical protein